MYRAFIVFILQHLAHFCRQYPFFCFNGLFERARLTTLALHALDLVLIMRVSPINGVSQQYDQFGIGHDRRGSLWGVRMKQVVWARLSRDVPVVVSNLQRKMGTIPIVTFCKVEIEIVDFLSKGWLQTRMLHQELVKKRSSALLCPDNDEVWQRSYWS